MSKFAISIDRNYAATYHARRRQGCGAVGNVDSLLRDASGERRGFSGKQRASLGSVVAVIVLLVAAVEAWRLFAPHL